MNEKKTFWKELLRVIEEHVVAKRELRTATTEIDGTRILAHLRATERALTARIDSLELYVDEVTEKYLKKRESKARYAKQKEEELIVEPVTGFEMIRQKYGGRE